MKPDTTAVVPGPWQRQREAWAHAWARRHELAGPARNADELAFLPDALRLQETPPHPLPRALALAIAALCVAAGLWATFGRLDIVAVAPGRIVVGERTKVVQPLEAGVVQRILVRDGDVVQAGQLLIELDATAADATGSQATDQWRAADAEVQRTAALLAALAGGQPPRTAPPGDAAAAAQTQAEWQDLAARLARLDAEAARRRAEATTVREAIAKLQALLPLAQRREADLQQLAAQGFVSGHAVQDRARERLEIESDIAVQRARLAEADAAAAEAATTRRALKADAERTLRQRQAQALLDRDRLADERTKAERQRSLMRLTAPVAGTVQQLAVHTAGGVVTPAQVLMVIVPNGPAGDAAGTAAGPDVTAEVVLSNTDIGFVKPGQKAVVKLEPFPFTRHGTVDATVLRIAADAVVDDKGGAVFPATLKLARPVIDIDGKPVRLTPGMNLTAEVITGRRRVIDYWITPVHRALDESLGER